MTFTSFLKPHHFLLSLPTFALEGSFEQLRDLALEKDCLGSNPRLATCGHIGYSPCASVLQPRRVPTDIVAVS